MSTRIIKTRIQNKIDSINSWIDKNPVLLSGELAIAQTTEIRFDEIAGTNVDVPVCLIKVGDGTKTFNELTWLKADAEDVFDWAKSEKAEDVSVTIIDSSETETTKTLAEWFEFISNAQASQDAAIAINTAKLTGHTDEAINDLINSKLSALDSTVDNTDAAGNIVVKDVTQTDGKVVVTKGPMLENDLPELHTDKIIVADAGTDSDKITLNTKLISLDTDIKNINTAIAGGVHFAGITTTDLSQTAAQTNNIINIKSSDNSFKPYTANIGDIVIVDATAKEFIWAGSAWQELGDQSRIGAIETKINGMDFTETNTVSSTNKFVSQVVQNDGKITVTYTRPTSANIEHTTNHTVSQELTSHTARLGSLETKLEDVTTVTASISDALSTLDVTDPASSGNVGNNSTFIDSIKQVDGKIVATKKTLVIPSATSSTAGITKLNDTVNSTSTSEAATANAVKKTYDLASAANLTANTTSSKVAAIESDYIRVNSTDSKMYLGKTGADEIIFDCGGAPI